MNTAGTLPLILLGSSLLVLVTTLALPQAPEIRPGKILTPQEERILLQPFASPQAQQQMYEELHRRERGHELKSLLPQPPSPKANANPYSMGWAQTDHDYWESIPPAARDIPSDWSHLPLVRFTNTELGGTREIRFREGKEYDQWFLKDPRHDLTACISIHRTTHRIYFMEVAQQKEGQWGYRIAFDNCYSCHSSGLRVIRPFDEPSLDRRTLTRFNRRILSYRACDFGVNVDSETRGERYKEAGCDGCHDGVGRGKLYSVHTRAILFKTEHEQTMPPRENRMTQNEFHKK